MNRFRLLRARFALSLVKAALWISPDIHVAARLGVTGRIDIPGDDPHRSLVQGCEFRQSHGPLDCFVAITTERHP